LLNRQRDRREDYASPSGWEMRRENDIPLPQINETEFTLRRSCNKDPKYIKAEKALKNWNNCLNAKRKKMKKERKRTMLTVFS
jgi:hypothetical protein